MAIGGGVSQNLAERGDEARRKKDIFGQFPCEKKIDGLGEKPIQISSLPPRPPRAIYFGLVRPSLSPEPNSNSLPSFANLQPHPNLQATNSRCRHARPRTRPPKPPINSARIGGRMKEGERETRSKFAYGRKRGEGGEGLFDSAGGR